MQLPEDIEVIACLTYVFYEDGGVTCAHCLELDMGGSGSTRENARADLNGAINAFLDDYLVSPEGWHLKSAPAELHEHQDREQWAVLLQAREPKRRHASPRVAFAQMRTSGLPFGLAMA